MKCPNCGKKLVDNGDMYRCEECKKLYRKCPVCNGPLIFEKEIRQFECSNCGKKFNTKEPEIKENVVVRDKASDEVKDEPVFDMDIEHECKKCHAKFKGKFCPTCGQDVTKEEGMKECPKCHTQVKEFTNFCPTCGYSFDSTKNKTKKAASNFITKAKEFIKKHKKIVMASCSAVLVLILVISLVVGLSNNFRVGKLSKINIGDSEAQVIKVLGTPTYNSESGSTWYYYEGKYEKLIKQEMKLLESDSFSDLEKVLDIEEEMDTLVHKEIAVSFSSGKVCSIYMNTNAVDDDELAAKDKKTLKKVELDNTEFNVGLAIKKADIVYTAKFKDGSYYKGTISSISNIDDIDLSTTGNKVIKWKDKYAEYSSPVQLTGTLPSYSISYELNGGTNNSDNSTSIKELSEAPTLYKPYRKYFIDGTKYVYTFLGWYKDSAFTQKVTSLGNITESIKLYAKWEETAHEAQTYNISYNLGGGTNNSSNPTTYSEDDDEIIIENISDMTIGYKSISTSYIYVNNEVTFEGWYLDSGYTNPLTKDNNGLYVLTNQGSDVTLYAKWENIESTTFSKTTYTRVDENKVPSTTGNYVMFGEYPQTLKETGVTITSTTDSRGYYLGSDGMYYALYSSNYYRVEPIMWKITKTDSGKLTIVSTIALDKHRFDDDSNNYANSEIRSWLNGEFYTNAFVNCNSKIQTTTVDNSVASTGDDPNPNACSNTQDKVFLLSYVEATSWYTSSTERQMQVTSYAKARGVSSYSSDCCYWWLRSPIYGIINRARNVYDGGYVSTDNVSNVFIGVVPALTISI